MSIVENLFPFLFVFFKPTTQIIFSSIWILIIFTTALGLSLKFYKKDYLSCSIQLKDANQTLLALIENKASFEEIKKSLTKDKLIGHYWSEFWESVVVTKNPDGSDQVFNTIDAHHFFNEDNLINHQIDTRLYNAIPGILTGLGILGTFLGLIFGLSKIDLTTSDPEQLREGIKGLLEGATIAFSTSIWGILLSIAFSVLEKWGIKNLSTQVDNIQRRIDKLFDRKTTEELLCDIRSESIQQSNQLKRFNDDLAISIASALEEKLAEKLTPSLDKLFEAIEGLNNAGVKSISESITKSAGNEFERVAQIMRGVGESMQTTANHGQQIQSDLENSLKENIDKFSVKVEEVFSGLTKTADDHSDKIQNQINDLNSTTIETTNRISNLVEELTNKFSANMNQATQSISEERESVSRLIERVNGSVDKMTNLMEEAGLVADTFKESSQPVKEAVSFLNTQVREISRMQQEFIKASESSNVNWNNSIEKMENVFDQLKVELDETKGLWSGYKDNFDNLRENLNAVFTSMNEGLIGYRKETGDGLKDYLHEFDRSIADGLAALQGAIESLSEVVEDINEKGN
jgi:ABC-type transporter Mla subunit MlaD